MRAAPHAVLATLAALAAEAGAEPRTVEPAAAVVAQALAEAIVARDAEAAAILCAVPATLDGQVASTREELRDGWDRALGQSALRGVRVERVELLPIELAIERFGPPPARLGPLPVEGAFVAILRLDRTQLVAVLARVDGRWAVVAVTD